MRKNSLKVVHLNSEVTGLYPQAKMPTIMPPEMMKRLLGGKWPKTGFAWECVQYFKFEQGTWQPYNGMNEILPAAGFTIKAQVEKFTW